jgi:hypothetical protein
LSDVTPEPGASAGPAKTWSTVAIVLAVAVVVVATAGVYFVMQRSAAQRASAEALSRRGMAMTALTGIEALISGDAAKLSAISNETLRAQLTPAFVASMGAAGLQATFSEPKWSGDSFQVTVDSSRGQGVVLGGPVPDGRNVVLFRTMGMIGATSGGMELTPGSTSWVITALTAGPSAPASASVGATATTTP